MSNSGKVVSVNISEKKGTIKKPVEEIVLNDEGIVGDAHAGKWHRQVSLLSQESIEIFKRETDADIHFGAFAENLTISGIDFKKILLLDSFHIGDVILEVTQIGKKCHGKGCAVYQSAGKCVMPKEGIFCRVIQEGTIKKGYAVQHVPRCLKVQLITLSDRAFAGEYEDRSGSKADILLRAFTLAHHWNIKIEKALLPDDANLLKEKLSEAIDNQFDVIFTLGGTGIGPRDIATETVVSICQKLMPGIMEHIRVRFGSKNPNALLSRSIAGITNNTQIYALPGSVKAVEEYLAEIFKILEHVIFMLNEIDVHG